MRLSRVVLFALLAALTTACGNEHELLRLGGQESGQANGDPPWPQVPASEGDDPDAGDQDDGEDRETPDRSDRPDGSDGEEAPGEEGDGCTLTQGYWKNHEEAWPVDALSIGGVSYSAPELDALLGTPAGGDASLILGHQLIAALLNIASGAGIPPEVDAALDSAQQWMAAHADADGRLPYATPSGSDAHSQGTSLGDTLADFNEGAIGPGHCR